MPALKKKEIVFIPLLTWTYPIFYGQTKWFNSKESRKGTDNSGNHSHAVSTPAHVLFSKRVALWGGSWPSLGTGYMC